MGVVDSKRVGWPGGLAKLSGRWSSGGDVARDMGDDCDSAEWLGRLHPN